MSPPDFLEPSERLEGRVDRVIFHNEETGYAVLSIAPNRLVLGNDGGLVTVVGVVPRIFDDDEVYVEGQWVNNPRYGIQLKATIIKQIMPASREGMIRYLSSGMIKGVGKKIAGYIVDAFGTETLTVLDSPAAIERLQTVRKVTAKKAEQIVEAWQAHREAAEVMILLQQYGIGQVLAYKIYKFYEEENRSALHVLKTNPYDLVKDIQGVGFRKADTIAQNLGIPADSPFRIQAGIFHALDQASSSDGHVYLPTEEVLSRAATLLQLTDLDPIQEQLDTLLFVGELYAEELLDPFGGGLIKGIYSPMNYRSERGATRFTYQVMATDASTIDVFQSYDNQDWQDIFETIAQHASIQLTRQQENAVRTALVQKISILTGGPGTGKTTTMRAVIDVLETHGFEYMLMAPTGRAAKRLAQATGREARTIHRSLGFSGFEFANDEYNPLITDFIVVDEASMLDLYLYYALVRAIQPDTHILFVGDVDQLPSVGAGDVLRDLIRSKEFAVTRLDVIFRQDADSRIISNAHAINRGDMPDLANQSSDFFFFGMEDVNQTADMLIDVVVNRIPTKFGYHPVEEVQVLAPMYRGVVGVNALNQALQARLNPAGKKAEIILAGTLFRVGDKVMQTRNNYDKSVFNGDVGRVYAIDPKDRQLVIRFEDLPDKLYEYDEADELTLAYACSVHRSQGSEYPVVVVPMVTQHYMLLQRNLFYTAVTRARKLVVLVGSRRAVGMAVRNDAVTQRWTALDWRITESLK